MKTKLIIVLVSLFVLCGFGWCLQSQHQKIKKLNRELIVASNNNKAYEVENSALNDKIIEFQLTADQLNASNDSLVLKLNETRKQLKIKDKQIKSLQYLASETKKKDTIRVKDTIFVENAVLDTLIRDEWSSLQIHGEFPNLLDVEYSFKNETSIIAHSEKVTVDPPKKCWIGRLFQKKQTIVEIDVVQENPYCENKNEKFIKIIEKN